MLGDLAQGTTPWATASWAESLTHLGKPGRRVEELVAGFRVPGEVIDFAARLLPAIAPQLTPPHSVRRHRGELDLRHSRRYADDVIIATTQALEREGTVGVIVPDAAVPTVRKTLEKAGLRYDLLGEDAQIFDTRIDLVPASLAKGLEFDHVVLLEPADIVAGEPDEVTGSTPPLRLPDPRRHVPGGGPLRPAPRRPRGLNALPARILHRYPREMWVSVQKSGAVRRGRGCPGCRVGPAASVTAAPSGRARLRGP